MKKYKTSFINAIHGMTWVCKTQPNFKIQLSLSLLALVAAFLLRASYFEFLIIISLIFLGLMVETINTAIEAATNAIDDEWREDIKIAKDVSAAAMLIFSSGALIIALIIFLPKILYLIARLQ